MFEQKYRQIGAKITYFRKIRRYTQEELAFRASISASYLSRIERGAYAKWDPLINAHENCFGVGSRYQQIL